MVILRWLLGSVLALCGMYALDVPRHDGTLSHYIQHGLGVAAMLWAGQLMTFRKRRP